MNCEKCQELISDLLDGTLNREDEIALNAHLGECLLCAEVRSDLGAIVGFCRQHRGEYVAPPNERALWLRIHNTLESEVYKPNIPRATPKQTKSLWAAWLGRSWELSLPQLVASVAAIVLVVSLATTVGVRRWQSAEVSRPPTPDGPTTVSNVRKRMWQQEQTIKYWNQRVELNKARWNPQMRETFDRNLQVIDRAVNDSFNDLSKNPHDEISEEMLNAALNEKLSLLKEFADL